MAKRDYYEVLGITQSATKDEIKKAYRKVAVANHPDRNPGDAAAEQRFKEATEAYEVLADEKRRKTYDQFGFAGLEGMNVGSGGYQHAYHDFEDLFSGFGGGGGLGSIFESFFGGGAGRSTGQRSRGGDIRQDITLSFADAVYGKKITVSYSRLSQCGECDGSGARHGTRGVRTCPSCGGSGQVRRNSGFFTIASTCGQCRGEGTIIESPCHKCRGTGRNQKKHKLSVTIPAGIEDGQHIVLNGQGNVGSRGEQAGNLIITVNVTPHDHFERIDNDLYCIIPISYVQATTGCELYIPTLDDRRIKIKVPSGSQCNRLFRLRGEGVENVHTRHKGDFYVRIVVAVPESYDSKYRKILKELEESAPSNNRPDPLPLSAIKNM